MAEAVWWIEKKRRVARAVGNLVWYGLVWSGYGMTNETNERVVVVVLLVSESGRECGGKSGFENECVGGCVGVGVS